MALGLKDRWEWLFFVTCLGVGMCMMMGLNAVDSAPNYILYYYQYVTGDANAKPANPNFWKHVMTYYSVVTDCVQLTLEPINITQFLCRFSLLFRLESSIVLLLVELLIIMLTPHGTSTQNGGIAALMCAAVIGGIGRAFCENTGFALAGAAPAKIRIGTMMGLPLSGVLTSTMQIILLATMSTDYDAIITQSIIYFTIAIIIIFATGVLLALLLRNPVAQEHIAEFRSSRSVWKNIYRPIARDAAEAYRDADDDDEGRGRAQEQDSNSTPHEVVASGMISPSLLDAAREDGGATPAETGVETPELKNLSDLRPVAETPSGLTTAELAQKAKLLPVLKKIYPMIFACSLNFFISCLLFPGLLIAVNPNGAWFGTIIIALFNYGDLTGRIFTLSPRTWLPRKYVVIASICRLIFVPLLLLCATGKIKSEVAAYLFTAFLGMTNGFIGTLCVIYSPLTPGLTDGEKVIAGQCTDVSLISGCTFGALLQIPLVLPFP